MPSTLNFKIALLEDCAEDAALIATYLRHPNGIKSAVKENFPELEQINIEVVLFSCWQELLEAIQGGLPNRLLGDLKLLVLDYMIPLVPGGDTEELPLDELEKVLPIIPKILMTVQKAARIENTIEDLLYVHKDKLQNRDDFLFQLNGYLVKLWQSPFWKKLKEYVSNSQVVESWHTPGHNFGNSFDRSVFIRDFYTANSAFPFRSDLSISIPELGNLSELSAADNPMAESMKRAAEVYGADQTYFITNGTSSSNRALLATLLRPYDVVILDRNCHKSIHQAVILSKVIPYYITPVFNETLGIWLPLTVDQIREAINRLSGIGITPRMLIVTSTTYDGVAYPLSQIVQEADSRNILVYADEAWFPYGRFHPKWIHPDWGSYSAIDAGAHVVVHSTHKTLSAFSQASMIHTSKTLRQLFERGEHWFQRRFNTIDQFHHTLKESLGFTLSTSPLYPVIASLDVSVTQAMAEGLNLIEERLNWAREIESEIPEVLSKEDICARQPGFEDYMKDPLKLSIGVKKGKLKQLKSFLRNNGQNPIGWEKSTSQAMLFLLTFGSEYSHVQSLLFTLGKARNNGYLEKPETFSISSWDDSQQISVLPAAAHNATGEFVVPSEAVDRIAAQMIVPYPPGIPTILPGVKINKEATDYLNLQLEQNNEVHGFFGEGLVKVLTHPEEQAIMARMTAERFEKISRLRAPD